MKAYPLTSEQRSPLLRQLSDRRGHPVYALAHSAYLFAHRISCRLISDPAGIEFAVTGFPRSEAVWRINGMVRVWAVPTDAVQPLPFLGRPPDVMVLQCGIDEFFSIAA